MGLLNKLGIAIGHAPREGVRSLPQGRNGNNGHSGASAVAAGAHRLPEIQETTRVSNGLKEFLWNLDGLGRGTMLDLGPAWQTTLNFFIERGFRVSSEDIMREWKDFLSGEEVLLKDARVASEDRDMTPAGRAARFLGANLQYQRASFDAVLLWDSLDYMEPAMAKQAVANLTELLRP